MHVASVVWLHLHQLLHKACTSRERMKLESMEYIWISLPIVFVHKHVCMDVCMDVHCCCILGLVHSKRICMA